MIITDIQRRRGGIFDLISGRTVVASLITQVYDEAEDVALGADLSQERLEELQYISDYKQAKNKALDMIARREVCRRQVERKLTDSGFESELSEEVAQELEQCGLINDRRFAEMYAEDMFKARHLGMRRVIYELTQKGVDRDVAEDAACELAPDPADELDALLDGRLGREALSGDAGYRRTANTLARYGYDGADIRAAMRRLRENALDDEEEE